MSECKNKSSGENKVLGGSVMTNNIVEIGSVSDSKALKDKEKKEKKFKAKLDRAMKDSFLMAKKRELTRKKKTKKKTKRKK